MRADEQAMIDMIARIESKVDVVAERYIRMQTALERIAGEFTHIDIYSDVWSSNVFAQTLSRIRATAQEALR